MALMRQILFSEEGDPFSRDRLVRGGVWALIGKLITAIAAMGVIATLARLLPVKEIGSYFLLLNFATFCALLAQLGLPQATIRYVAASIASGHAVDAKKTLVFAFSAMGVASIVVAGALVFGGGAFIGEHLFESSVFVSIVPLCGIWLILLAYQALIGEGLRAFDDVFMATSFGGMLASVLSLVFLSIAWAISLNVSLDQAVKLIMFALGISVAIGLFFIRGHYRSLLVGADPRFKVSNILPVSAQILVTNIAYFCLCYFDIWLLGYFGSEEEVAVYAATARTAALIGLPLLIIAAITPQFIAALYANGERKRLEMTLQAVTTVVAVFSFALFLPIILIGKELLGLMFGDYFREGYVVLLILGGSQMLNVLTGPCGILLNMTGNHRAATAFTVLGAGVAIGFALVLIPLFGINGAAVATMLGMVTQNLSIAIYAKIVVGIRSYGSVSALFRIRDMVT